jgi:hypothetical protein
MLHPLSKAKPSSLAYILQSNTHARGLQPLSQILVKPLIKKNGKKMNQKLNQRESIIKFSLATLGIWSVSLIILGTLTMMGCRTTPRKSSGPVAIVKNQPFPEEIQTLAKTIETSQLHQSAQHAQLELKLRTSKLTQARVIWTVKVQKHSTNTHFLLTGKLVLNAPSSTIEYLTFGSTEHNMLVIAFENSDQTVRFCLKMPLPDPKPEDTSEKEAKNLKFSSDQKFEESTKMAYIFNKSLSENNNKAWNKIIEEVAQERANLQNKGLKEEEIVLLFNIETEPK